ncbi:hypothetical protein [Streptomyces megasporus]|uniref:hypothetical protein n=1 Tax=Streptomyces megasporus TaxID=44060 RepID=UPI00055A42BC|nr:hypothetical protein [Streptomyces megasporus]
MEQRIGSITPPPAGTDPAYIPGLTPPAPAEAEEKAPKKETQQPPPEEVVLDGTDDAEGEPEETAEEGAEDDGADGPAFEVSDHRGSIAADRTGVTLRLDGEEASFPWKEIGAVQIDLPLLGRRFSVTVHTTARRWYDADVQAPSRKLLKQWSDELDAVLDAYFEDADADAKQAEETTSGDDAR